MDRGLPDRLIYLQIFSDSLLSQFLAPPHPPFLFFFFKLHPNAKRGNMCFNLTISRKHYHTTSSRWYNSAPAKRRWNQQVSDESIWFSTPKAKRGNALPPEIKNKFRSNLCIYVVMVLEPSSSQVTAWLLLVVCFTVDFVRTGSFLLVLFIMTKLTTEIGKFIFCLE